MRLRDLQQILEKFTNGQKGTMISDCPVYIESMSGHLEDVRRIEIQESTRNKHLSAVSIKCYCSWRYGLRSNTKAIYKTCRS